MIYDVTVWAVYDRPTEYPAHYAVRSHAFDGGRLSYAGECGLFPSLEDARESLLNRGLVCVPRNPADDPVIVECWI